MRRLSAFIFCTLTLWGCSTDVDVNAPFVETPIIYSVLNSEDSIQAIRVQKAFSGENGNALELSQDRDQIYYDPSIVSVRLELTDPTLQNQVVFVDTLQYTICDSCKDEGDFYSDSVPVYLTTKPLPIDPASDDPLDAFIFFMNQESGLEATAETNLVPCFPIKLPQFRCNNVTSNPRMVFDEIELAFNGPENGALSLVTMIALYFEQPITGGQPIEKTTETEPWIMVNNFPLTKGEGFEYEFKFDTLAFGNYLNGAVDTSNNADVESRLFVTADFYFSIFNQDYYDYQLINNNYNPITQTSPTYTNINNGLGLLGGRTLRIVPNVAVQTARLNYYDNWPSLKVK